LANEQPLVRSLFQPFLAFGLSKLSFSFMLCAPQRRVQLVDLGPNNLHIPSHTVTGNQAPRLFRRKAASPNPLAERFLPKLKLAGLETEPLALAMPQHLAHTRWAALQRSSTSMPVVSVTSLMTLCSNAADELAWRSVNACCPFVEACSTPEVLAQNANHM
jgi:hypothetical protein